MTPLALSFCFLFLFARRCVYRRLSVSSAQFYMTELAILTSTWRRKKREMTQKLTERHSSQLDYPFLSSQTVRWYGEHPNLQGCRSLLASPLKDELAMLQLASTGAQ